MLVLKHIRSVLLLGVLSLWASTGIMAADGQIDIIAQNTGAGAKSNTSKSVSRSGGRNSLTSPQSMSAVAASEEEAVPQDPANIGMTMKAVEEEIAKIDAKGADANEADKSSKADFQMILELDQQILNYARKTRVITRIIGDSGNSERRRNDQYNSENLEKFFKEIERQYKNLKRLSLNNLVVLQGNILTFVDGAQKEQSRMEGYVESINSLPRDFQNKSSELTDKIIANRNSLAGMAMGTENVSLRLRLEAEIVAAQAELAFSQFVMQNSNILYERLRGRISNIKQTIDKLSSILAGLSRRVTVIKQTEVLSSEKEENNQLLAEAKDSVLAKALAEDNNELIKRLSQGFQNTRNYNEHNEQLLKLIDRTRKVESDIDSQIKYFENSVFLSQILFNQRYIIPDFSIPAGLSEEVGRLRMEIYGYGVELEQVSDPELYLPEFVANQGVPVSALKEYEKSEARDDDEARVVPESAITRKINRLIELREAILTRLYSETTVEVNSAVNVMINYEKYMKLKGNLNEQIYERMFWSPSNNSLFKAGWFLKFPEELEKQVAYTKGNAQRVSWKMPSLAIFPPAVLFTLIALGLWVLRGRIKKKIDEINGRLSSFVTDSQLNTPRVLALTATATLWLPLLVFVVGAVLLNCAELSDQADTAIRIRESVFMMLGIFCLCLWGRNFIMAVFGPTLKIAEKHFVQTIHAGVLKCIGRILAVFSITLILCLWKVEEPQTLAIDVVGQLVLIGLSIYLWFEFLLWEILIWKGQRAIGGVFINLIPLAISGLVVVLAARGYYYSGAVVTMHFVASFFVCFAYIILSNMIARSMKLSSRRINYKRWQESRKNASSGVKDEHPDHESDFVDLAEKEMSTREMSSQTLVIVRYVLLSFLCVALYHIWSGLLSVTSYFEYISLYDIKADDNSVIRSVSLMDILFVLYGLVLTYVFLRNMPGVLEVLVFNRFKKISTYGYSIITLCNYVCIGVATVFCLSRLGISWAELQWMVAALSVGLGFGLQEIFANFISGIILLFERPIRIGDIITINDNSGVVSKIRIRATTIINFDYKEYVVPNKEFITNPIVNWSLNDTMTRIVVEVGVGYGTDVDQARQALYRVAEANAYTLKDPAPNVYFLSFGDSNLNFELRVYVKKISERNTCLDSLNTEIYNEFNRLGIEIAFNQMDVYIKNVRNGQEIKVKNTNGELPNNLMSAPAETSDTVANANIGTESLANPEVTETVKGS